MLLIFVLLSYSWTKEEDEERLSEENNHHKIAPTSVCTWCFFGKEEEKKYKNNTDNNNPIRLLNELKHSKRAQKKRTRKEKYFVDDIQAPRSRAQVLALA